MQKTKYCPECNYGINQLEIDLARFDYPCPNCETSRISDFYSLGSKKHKQILKGNARSNAPRHKRLKAPSQTDDQRRAP